MNDTKTFKRYNFVTGAVDGTLAYDFSHPAYYPPEEIETTAPAPKAKPEAVWVKEEIREKVSAAVLGNKQGFSPLAFIGAALVAVLLVFSLLAHIQLVNISQQVVEMEDQIAALEVERDKLTVEYEAVFNLKDVEEYAVGVLGMQEPRDDQVYYLSNVSSADKAVVISGDGMDMFALGLEDIVSSFKAYWSR